jgi:hypothetical protein
MIIHPHCGGRHPLRNLAVAGIPFAIQDRDKQPQVVLGLASSSHPPPMTSMAMPGCFSSSTTTPNRSPAPLSTWRHAKDAHMPFARPAPRRGEGEAQKVVWLQAEPYLLILTRTCCICSRIKWLE